MKSFTIAIGVSTLLGALVAGCTLPTVPGQEQEQPQQEQQPEATTLAGTWTREGENPRVFDVTDDGANVHGDLRGAADAGFTSYTFDLAKKAGGALEGTAKFELADMAGKTFEAAWSAKVDGTTIKIKAEELGLDDLGEVVERTKVEHTYALAAAAYEAPAMPAMDMSAYVTPLPSYKHLLSDEVTVGQWIDVETVTAAGKSVTRTAVVGDAGDAWILEVDNQMNQKDLLLAVFVNKDTGEATKAFVGNRGKDGAEKAITPAPEAQGGEAPQGVEEEITVAAGTFPATKFESSGTTVWTGVAGSEAEGVMLKVTHAAGGDELVSLEVTSFDAAGSAFEARHLVYTSGNEMIMAIAPRPFLGQLMLRMKGTGIEMTLVGLGEDAAPQFNYPR